MRFSTVQSCWRRTLLTAVLALGGGALSAQEPGFGAWPNPRPAVVREALAQPGLLPSDPPSEGEDFPAEPTPEFQKVYYQPGAGAPRVPTPRPPSSAARPSSNMLAMNDSGRTWESYASRPARVMGDLFFGGGKVLLKTNQTGEPDLDAPLLLGGGAGRMSISDNNYALPEDRVIFSYNHFENAFLRPIAGMPQRASFPLDRYTFGFEKTFWDGGASLQLQMPVTGSFDIITGDVVALGQSAGNLQFALKAIVYEMERGAVALGLGVDAPTGADAFGQLGPDPYRVNNDAFHIAPFLAYSHAFNDAVFTNGFLQIDFATNGGDVRLGSAAAPEFLGRMNDQTLLRFSESVGYWLYRDPESEGLTGLAALLELHYTTTLQDADILNGSALGTTVSFGNTDNRIDLLNITAGVHFELFNQLELRVGAGAPLLSGSNRSFDTELIVQSNWRF